MWIGFLSTWVVRMVRENSIERCGRAVGSPRLMVDEDKEGDGCGQSLKEVRPSSTIYPNNLMGITY